MSSRYDEWADELEAIADQIADVSMDQLREAVESGTGQRPADEKRLAQARRSIDKAVRLLRQPPA